LGVAGSVYDSSNAPLVGVIHELPLPKVSYLNPATPNFRSWNPLNENDLDEVFTFLVSEPEHQNNGTLAGRANEQLANTLRSPWWRASRSGGWIFNGYKGVSVKPNSLRTDSEGKVIKYESPRGVGNQQIFIPRVCVRVGRIIATKI
jgi:putative DNA primase/helicase